MGTKERLLSLLEQHKGEYLSGEELAERLQVSRTSIWKAVNALRAGGFRIDAAQNRGYCLDVHTDFLSKEGIGKLLEERWRALELEVLPCTDSTNSLVRQRAVGGAEEGLVVVANQQTQGRGRLGRSFFSPPDSGIYLSLLLRPKELPPEQAVKLTTMAAVAACEAIEAVSGKRAEIKWVNDIFLHGKKVCGILTEGGYSLETGLLDYVIPGIGFNVYEPQAGFPEELENIAGPILPAPTDGGKNRLAAAFLNRFLDIYTDPEHSGYADAYRERSMVIGKRLRVITAGETRTAWALDVDRDCRLIVRYDDGTVEHLSSAEVSVAEEK